MPDAEGVRIERPVVVHLSFGQEGPIVYAVQRVDGALLFAHLLH